MRILLETALALFVGLMMTRIFKYLKLNFPDVTAFLIAGILVGPFVMGKLGIHGIGFGTMKELESVSSLSNVALGFIAFDIGNEFRLAQLKETGKTATVIGVIQALMATVLVDAILIVLHFILGPDTLPLPVAITLGAIASATAPAATLMVVRQYKAKGPLTDLLLPIVALDDAVGLVVFSVSFGIAQAMVGGTMSVVSVIVNPLLEILFSLILGSVMGMFLTLLEKTFFSNSNRLSLTISFVIMTIAMASREFEIGGGVKIGFSSLLVCMMLGTVFCNFSEYSVDIMNRSSKWTAPLYALFFVLSGAELDLGVFR
ncbi:MAG: cation:proton antiporter, partial [bacterium]